MSPGLSLKIVLTHRTLKEFVITFQTTVNDKFMEWLLTAEISAVIFFIIDLSFPFCCSSLVTGIRKINGGVPVFFGVLGVGCPIM